MAPKSEAFQNLSTVQNLAGSITPPTIASASVISPVTFISKISGSTPLKTINPPIDGAHLLSLIFLDSSPSAFDTSGNIALSITPTQYGQVLISYDPVSKLYYPIGGQDGSNPFDQDLNTFDDVEFNTVHVTTRASIGVAVNANRRLYLVDNVTDLVNSAKRGIQLFTTLTPDADTEQQYKGVYSFIQMSGDFNYGEYVHAFQGIVQADGDFNQTSVNVGIEGSVGWNSTGDLAAAYGAYGFISNQNVGSITDAYAIYSEVVNSGGGTIDHAFLFWGQDLASVATDGYYFWNDSRGVFAIKEEFTQAVPRLYNPLFTKYTPGAADYERWITRYGITGQYGVNDNLYLGSEAGGTGTLRQMNLLGAGIGFNATPGVGTFLEGFEIGDPAAPASDGGRIYFKDNGAGKTLLVVRFSSGAVQTIATQP